MIQGRRQLRFPSVLESIHLADFPVFEKSYIDKSLERKMEDAQTISSLVLSLRAKEKIKVRQPLQKIMIPVENKEQKSSILAVANIDFSFLSFVTSSFFLDALNRYHPYPL